ncbi:MAG: hypothetical protein CVU00_04765 [Bacteroidetes bacterium HGW-Bacteroidetes-17]|nr:MAG: hypothetical protein CVU00_04765 [Bacteroidetes bacterium HGW-Bacteroidetes-17]
MVPSKGKILLDCNAITPTGKILNINTIVIPINPQTKAFDKIEVGIFHCFILSRMPIKSPIVARKKNLTKPPNNLYSAANSRKKLRVTTKTKRIVNTRTRLEIK